MKKSKRFFYIERKNEKILDGYMESRAEQTGESDTFIIESLIMQAMVPYPDEKGGMVLKDFYTRFGKLDEEEFDIAKNLCLFWSTMAGQLNNERIMKVDVQKLLVFANNNCLRLNQAKEGVRAIQNYLPEVSRYLSIEEQRVKEADAKYAIEVDRTTLDAYIKMKVESICDTPLCGQSIYSIIIRNWSCLKNESTTYRLLSMLAMTQEWHLEKFQLHHYEKLISEILRKWNR